MDYEPYLEKGLTSFEDTLNAFTLFKEGGYWVKKIVNKGGFFREIVEGPYKKKEAEDLAKDWKNYFKYKDQTTAQVFDFYKLCCNFELDNNKKAIFYEEHIWQPPKGIELFCLTREPEKIAVIEKKNTNNTSFEKFYTYTYNNEIRNKEILGYLVFYNERNFKSIIAARVAIRLIKEFVNMPVERDAYIEYLVSDKIVNDFLTIPEYLKEFKKTCFIVYLSTFREFSEIKNINTRLDKFYKKLFNCLPRENFHLDVENIGMDFYLILNKRDYQAKIMKLEKKDKNYILSMGDEDYYIKLVIDKKLQANIEINLGKELENFSDQYTQGDKKFQKINNFMGLFLYLAKCLGVKKINYKADQQVPCVCDDSGTMLYEEIINLLAGKKSIYQSIGFVNKKQSEVDTKISNFQTMLLSDFLNKKNEEEIEEDPFLKNNLKEIANMYLKGICNYEYGCYLMDKINLKIYQQLKSILDYELDLNEKSLIFFRKMF